uniref:Uncharacterized protein n=1 Tax=viral metagenome TaxID=1070528 RepID=A0A6C0I3Z5_9ZZZZ
MAIQLNNANYAALISSIQGFFSAGGIKAVTMTVYDDAEATTTTIDVAGAPINERAIASAVKKDSGENTIGSVTVLFADGTTLEVAEDGSGKWYVLSTKGYI